MGSKIAAVDGTCHRVEDGVVVLDYHGERGVLNKLSEGTVFLIWPHLAKDVVHPAPEKMF